MLHRTSHVCAYGFCELIHQCSTQKHRYQMHHQDMLTLVVLVDSQEIHYLMRHLLMLVDLVNLQTNLLPIISSSNVASFNCFVCYFDNYKYFFSLCLFQGFYCLFLVFYFYFSLIKKFHYLHILFPWNLILQIQNKK